MLNFEIRLLIITTLSLCCVSVEYTTLSLITSFLQQNSIASAVIVTCWSDADKVLVTKYFSDKNIMSKFQAPDVSPDISTLLWTDYNHLAVIVDLQCAGSIHFVSQADRRKHLKLQHHWLLLAETNYSRDGLTAEDPLITALEPLSFPLDSQVFIAHSQHGVEKFLLQEIYKIGPGLPLIFTPLLEWSPGQILPLKFRRDNYGGILINAATVVIDDVWENFFDMRYKHINSLGKCNYMLMLLVSQMLNFTMNLTLVDTWGFPRKGTNCYDGVVGLLQCGNTELGALAILYKEARMDRIDYAGETFVFGLSFKFLKPSLSEVSIIYTLPFSRSVWVTYTMSVAILAVALYLTERMERSMNPSRTDPPLLFADAALYSLAIMCAEGSPRSPQNMSSRIVFLFLLLLSLFLTTSYSAIIVSLLQTPSNAVKSLTDLIDSPFKLSMKDIAYNTKFVNDTTDPEIKRMFHQKLYTQPYHQAFTTEEIGVEKLRKGLYAFYAGSEAYKIMSDTYEEHEKCKLKEISINPSNVLAFPVKKGSPYREHITQKARRLKEAGMVDREYKRWFTQRPKCGANSQGFVSVRIKDFYPTLVVLSIGIIGSIMLYILEIMYHKIRYGTYWPSDYSETTRTPLIVTRQQQPSHAIRCKLSLK